MREAPTLRAVTLTALVAVLVAFALPAPFAGADACVPLCTVPSATAGFVPPATVVVSGSTVTWTADDATAHTATSSNFCFHVVYAPSGPGSASFRIEDGTLRATSIARGDRACAEAQPLPGGAFRLSYVCLYHPLMKGDLVVVPEV